jgi:hypothetical protein
MNKLIYFILSACLITGLLTPACSSCKPAVSNTSITNSSTTTTGFTADDNYLEQANQILSLLLKSHDSNGDYTVVSPETSTGVDWFDTAEEAKNYIIDTATRFNTLTYDFTNLANQLYEINLKYKYLTLQSSTKDGYYVDYDGKFSQYFEKDGGGWEQWHQEHPEAHGSTSISIPAYAPKTGYILIYMGTQYDWLMGSGGLYVFKYIHGKLTEIDHSQMWVS